MAKIIDKIVQSATEPSKNDLWLNDGQLKAFQNGQWKPLSPQGQGGQGGGENSNTESLILNIEELKDINYEELKNKIIYITDGIEIKQTDSIYYDDTYKRCEIIIVLGKKIHYIIINDKGADNEFDEYELSYNINEFNGEENENSIKSKNFILLLCNPAFCAIFNKYSENKYNINISDSYLEDAYNKITGVINVKLNIPKGKDTYITNEIYAFTITSLYSHISRYDVCNKAFDSLNYIGKEIYYGNSFNLSNIWAIDIGHESSIDTFVFDVIDMYDNKILYKGKFATIENGKFSILNGAVLETYDVNYSTGAITLSKSIDLVSLEARIVALEGA